MLSRIISLYKKVQKDINKSNSGKNKFSLILSFVLECENTFNSTPPFTLIKDFISVLLDVILKSDINFTDPSKLNAAKFILNESKKEFINTKSGEDIVSQIEKAVDILNMQMLKSYFYLGKYDDGLVVLNNMLNERESFFNKTEERQEPKKKEVRNIRANKYALVNPDIYKESKAYEILTEIKNELDRLNSFSDSTINILLVEHDVTEQNYSSGTIQSLLCTTERKKKEKDKQIEFENITELEDKSLEETLKDIYACSNKLIKSISGKHIGGRIKRRLRFQNVKGIYKGASLGLGGAILSTCNHFNFANKRKRYLISNSAAFTGAINKDGKVLMVNSESIKNKVEAAFFSWVKYCIVPKENLNDAIEALEDLKLLYPTKNFQIIGVENVVAIFENKDIIRVENIAFRDYTAGIYNNNKIISLTILFLITSVIVFLTAYKFLPKDIKPLPKTENEMYIIYTPDRDTNWVFRNENFFGGDTINFGDVAIGDQWFPLIEFWNNGRRKEEFKVFIEGKDKEEFDLTWVYKNEQPEAPKFINEGVLQNLYVKFVPTNVEGSKNAVLVFENKSTKSRKEIYLKGISKRFNNGYCIDISEVDDALVLEPNSNLIQDNTTISFWIKPYFIDPRKDSFLFSIENNPLTNNKFGITIKSSDSTICLIFHGSKSTEIPRTIISTETKFNSNSWNYFGMSIKDSNLILVINETIKIFYIPQNTLRKFNDYIYFGALRPSERINTLAEYFVCKYYLDEFEIFNKALSPDELAKNKTDLNYQKDNLLVHCSFDDATSRNFFDNTTNDFWPKNYGGIRRVIDDGQPFKNVLKKNIADNKKNVAFCRQNKGFLKLNKNVYFQKSSFTLQCDLKVEKDLNNLTPTLFPTPFFINRSGLDVNFDPGYDSLYIRLLNNFKNHIYKKGFNVSTPYNWNKYTICYDINKNEYTFYINRNLILRLNDVDIQDITQNYMGISFALANYYGSPRFTSVKSFIDNIKLFNRSLDATEILSQTTDGLIAYWNFEKTDKELAYDEISNLPLLMIQPFELINEEIEIKQR